MRANRFNYGRGHRAIGGRFSKESVYQNCVGELVRKGISILGVDWVHFFESTILELKKY